MKVSSGQQPQTIIVIFSSYASTFLMRDPKTKVVLVVPYYAISIFLNQEKIMIHKNIIVDNFGIVF